MKIELSWGDVWRGVHVGSERRIAVLKRGGRDRYGADPELIAWKADIEGALAELAVARAELWQMSKLTELCNTP